MLRMVIARVCALFSAVFSKVSLCFASNLTLGFRIVRMVRARVWALLSAICPKVLLFLASSFNVGFWNATNSES